MSIVTSTSDLNKDHSLVIVNMSAKFDEEAHRLVYCVQEVKQTDARTESQQRLL